MDKEKTKIGIRDITDKELKSGLKKTGDLLKKLDTALSEIEATFKRNDAQVRMLLADALIGFVLNVSQVGPVINTGLLSKFKAVSMPYVVFANKNQRPKEETQYVG